MTDHNTSHLHLKDFHANIDSMPPGLEKFAVNGVVETPTGGWHISLVEQVPQGINPNIKLLVLKVTPPDKKAAEHITEHKIHFNEEPSKTSLYGGPNIL